MVTDLKSLADREIALEAIVEDEASAPWLRHYDTHKRHSALIGRLPVSRPLTT